MENCNKHKTCHIRTDPLPREDFTSRKALIYQSLLVVLQAQIQMKRKLRKEKGQSKYIDITNYKIEKIIGAGAKAPTRHRVYQAKRQEFERERERESGLFAVIGKRS